MTRLRWHDDCDGYTEVSRTVDARFVTRLSVKGRRRYASLANPATALYLIRKAFAELWHDITGTR